MDNLKIKTLPSPFVAFGGIFTVIFGAAMIVLIFCYPFVGPRPIWGDCMVIFLMGVLPIIIIIDLVYRGYYSVITISRKGIKRSLFGMFMKTEISWEELKELKFINRVVDNIFVSKNDGLSAMTFEQVIKKRDIIQMPLSKKVLKAIRKYTDKEIIGLPEEKIQSMIADKKSK